MLVVRGPPKFKIWSSPSFILVVLILLPYYVYVVLFIILLFLLVRERFVGMKIFGSILPQTNLVVRRTIRPQFLVVLTYFEDVRTLEFCYPAIDPCVAVGTTQSGHSMPVLYISPQSCTFHPSLVHFTPWPISGGH